MGAMDSLRYSGPGRWYKNPLHSQETRNVRSLYRQQELLLLVAEAMGPDAHARYRLRGETRPVW